MIDILTQRATWTKREGKAKKVVECSVHSAWESGLGLGAGETRATAGQARGWVGPETFSGVWFG